MKVPGMFFTCCFTSYWSNASYIFVDMFIQVVSYSIAVVRLYLEKTKGDALNVICKKF